MTCEDVGIRDGMGSFGSNVSKPLIPVLVALVWTIKVLCYFREAPTGQNACQSCVENLQHLEDASGLCELPLPLVEVCPSRTPGHVLFGSKDHLVTRSALALE